MWFKLYFDGEVFGFNMPQGARQQCQVSGGNPGGGYRVPKIHSDGGRPTGSHFLKRCCNRFETGLTQLMKEGIKETCEVFVPQLSRVDLKYYNPGSYRNQDDQFKIIQQGLGITTFISWAIGVPFRLFCGGLTPPPSPPDGYTNPVVSENRWPGRNSSGTTDLCV